MDKVSKLSVWLTGAALLVAGLSLYVLLLHERDHEKADYMPLIGGIVLFVVAACLVVWATVKNFQDASRATSLRAQIVTIKEEHELEMRAREKTISELEESIRTYEKEKQQASAQPKDLASIIPDGRLKIISAHYGIDGGPNADVAEKYIAPKVCGHSLAGWVGADLFGGFQPVIGKEKRVKVHYSFDGNTGVVSKKEHELLVLPDPSLVEIPRIVVTGLEEGDPIIIPSFVDGRKSPIPTYVSFELRNRGNRDALWVRISPIKLQKQIVFFDQIAESIAPTDFRQFYANVENQLGVDGNRDLIKALSSDWASRPDRDSLREIAYPARIDFEDFEGSRFECNFTLIYHGGRGYNQPVDFKCIECRDIYYRRIPRFVRGMS